MTLIHVFRSVDSPRDPTIITRSLSYTRFLQNIQREESLILTVQGPREDGEPKDVQERGPLTLFGDQRTNPRPKDIRCDG